MDFDSARRAIRECNLFQGLKVAQLGHLLMLAKPHPFKKGDTIFTKDDPKDSAFYLIVSGSVDIFIHGDEPENTCGPGEVLGEIGQVSPQGKRTATVKAAKDSELLEWDFQAIMKEGPAIGAHLSDRIEELAFQRLAQNL